uniref:NADH-ubiquinone oxidoreductase chain 2 n=1 Tax=Laccaria bicolor TaxID=29883 RepID=A0A4D6SWL0_LACBI|nr:NADH dehydrogenase subunit 2 [Laccaria bicolor]QCG70093.1 NADH dehydrogenase subunit 2 [Laccaria bicolor]
MIFISILTLIVAKALPLIHISTIHFTRVSAIIFIFSGVLTFNTFYIQSIGSGLGIYSGLFQINIINQTMEIFIYFIGSLILIAWPLILNNNTNIVPTFAPVNNHTLINTNILPTLVSVSSVSPVSSVSSVAAVLQQKTQNNYISVNISNKENTQYSTDYSLIVLFSTLGSSLLISSYDLISMYLSIELQSFGLYVLSTLYRDSESSTNAGLKYFLLGGLSSCLILLGSGLIYSYTGITNFESLYHLISVSELNYIIQGLSLGLIIILIGFLFKISAAPLHNWSPDVYDETPTIVTIWLTIMPKIAIILLLLEIQSQIMSIDGLTPLLNSGTTNGYQDYSNLGDTFSRITLYEKEISQSLMSPLNIIVVPSANIISILKNLFLISSILSLIIGTVVGLAQTRIKRLFAYSTISHIGFILLALAINTEQSIDSLLFYIIQYTITNLNVFLILLALSYHLTSLVPESVKDIRYITELKGQFFINPILSLSFSICLFSMAGIPPLIGFFSKQFVLYSALESGYYFISIIAIIVSVISASYYLKIIKVLHLVPTMQAQAESFAGTIVDHTTSEYKATENLVVNTTADIIVPINLSNNLNYKQSIADTSYASRYAGKINLTNFHSFLISSLTLSIVFFIFKPSIILNSTQLLSLSLFNS